MLKQRFNLLYKNRHILWNISKNKLKTRYAGSFLGLWLAIVNPLLLMLAITFVFKVVLKFKMEDFPLFVLSGIFPWMFFSSVLFEVTTIFQSQQNIVRQFTFPREYVPLSCVFYNFLNFLIGWSVVYPLFCFFNPAVLPFFGLFILILFLYLCMVCGLGLLASALNIFFRDISHVLGVLLMLWFWVTPIFYSAQMIPSKLGWAIYINPLASFVVFFRDVVHRASIPAVPIFIAVFCWAFASLFSGFWVFRHFESRILKEI